MRWKYDEVDALNALSEIGLGCYELDVETVAHGMSVEYAHAQFWPEVDTIGNDPVQAVKIVIQNLTEDPDYYKNLLPTCKLRQYMARSRKLVSEEKVNIWR